MTMNLERHMNAHVDLFNNLVKGDCDSVKQHQDFYEEYLAVMDLTAEFYLQTVKTVFQDHALPEGHDDAPRRARRLRGDPEYRADDGRGRARRHLRARPDAKPRTICAPAFPIDDKVHYVQQGVGHYGVFNGTRWRTEIQPRIREFIRTIELQAADRKHVQGSRVALSQAARRTRSDHLLERSRGENRRGQGGQDPVETGRCRVTVYDLDIVILGLVPRIHRATGDLHRVRGFELAHTR